MILLLFLWLSLPLTAKLSRIAPAPRPRVGDMTPLSAPFIGPLAAPKSHARDLRDLLILRAIRLFEKKIITVVDLFDADKLQAEQLVGERHAVAATLDVLRATLRRGERWDAVGSDLRVEGDLCRRLYKVVRNSMKDPTEPWSPSEDTTVMQAYRENEACLTVQSLAEHRSVGNLSNFTAFSAWRNISHRVGRASADCRLRVRALERSDRTDQGAAASTTTDVDSWAAWEIAQFVWLIGAPGQVEVDFAQVGRHLGRSSRQCYLCYRGAQYAAQYAAQRAVKSPASSGTESSGPTSEPTHIQTPLNTRSWASRRWTPEEDKRLVHLVELHGPRWTLISAQMGSRVPTSCFARHQLLSSKAELIAEAALNSQGESTVNGATAAATAKAVQAGTNEASLSVPTVLWTQEKKERLAALVATHGARWTHICSLLGPGHTPYSARTVYWRMALNSPDQLLIPRRSPVAHSSSQDPFYFVNASSILTSQRAAAVWHGTQQSSAGGEEVRKWSRQDDLLLTQLARQYNKEWNMVAEQMHRSPEDVMVRYEFKLSAHRNGAWTRKEDARLAEFVQAHGDGAPGWSKIGAELNRSAAQCALRWRLTLDPRLKWRPWSPDEDERLVFLREQRGYNWVMISASINRASSSCRYRYFKIKSTDSAEVQ